jgi:nitroreductase
MMRFNVSEINECIRTRRSIYPEQFSDRKVHKELIEVLLENARWAPTHKLTQPWRFKVFMEDGLKRFAEWHSETYKKITPPEKFKEMKYRKLRERPLKSSAVIAIVMQRDEKESIPVEEEIAAVAAAVQNMHITCSAYGLAAYWGSGGLTYTDEMKEFLGIGEKDLCLGMFFIGYPDIEWPRKTMRMERRKVAEFITE